MKNEHYLKSCVLPHCVSIIFSNNLPSFQPTCSSNSVSNLKRKLSYFLVLGKKTMTCFLRHSTSNPSPNYIYFQINARNSGQMRGTFISWGFYSCSIWNLWGGEVYNKRLNLILKNLIPKLIALWLEDVSIWFQYLSICWGLFCELENVQILHVIK